MPRPTFTLAFFIALALLTPPPPPADWPQWPGPPGQGLTEDPDLPTTWDLKTGENILWKSPLPPGDVPYSSPIVHGNRVFITLANNKTREHHVLAFDKAT